MPARQSGLVRQPFRNGPQVGVVSLLASALLLAMGAQVDAVPAASAKDEQLHQPGLLRQIPSDFRRLASRDSALVLGLGGALALAARPYDHRITAAASRSTRLDFFEPGAVAGGGWVQGGGAVATYALGRLARNPRIADFGSDLVRAQILNGVASTALKAAVGRRRPDGSSRLSFPSGHSSATFASATVVRQHFGWKAGVPAYVLAAYVAGSRLQANKHFTSDVVFGAALGITAGRAVTFGRRSRVALAPVLFPAGPGLALTFGRGSGRPR